MSLADLTPAEELAQAIGLELATEFIKHRKALKKPMTAYAARLMAKKLKAFADPVAAVERSILSGWTDVYPPDGNSTVRSGRTLPLRGVDAEREKLRLEIENERASEADKGAGYAGGLAQLGWDGPRRTH